LEITLALAISPPAVASCWATWSSLRSGY